MCDRDIGLAGRILIFRLLLGGLADPHCAVFRSGRGGRTRFVELSVRRPGRLGESGDDTDACRVWAELLELLEQCRRDLSRLVGETMAELPPHLLTGVGAGEVLDHRGEACTVAFFALVLDELLDVRKRETRPERLENRLLVGTVPPELVHVAIGIGDMHPLSVLEIVHGIDPVRTLGSAEDQNALRSLDRRREEASLRHVDHAEDAVLFTPLHGGGDRKGRLPQGLDPVERTVGGDGEIILFRGGRVGTRAAEESDVARALTHEVDPGGILIRAPYDTRAHALAAERQHIGLAHGRGVARGGRSQVGFSGRARKHFRTFQSFVTVRRACLPSRTPL